MNEYSWLKREIKNMLNRETNRMKQFYSPSDKQYSYGYIDACKRILTIIEEVEHE